MKIGRNDPCPCGSGKKYKKCCLLKNSIVDNNKSFLDTLQSDYNHLKTIAEKLYKRINKYAIEDIVNAVFCLNSWRKNRSALAQSLSLNMVIADFESFGTLHIQSYEQLTNFYEEIKDLLEITVMEDYIVDDYGEVFINHMGKTYPIIIGTGHQQVYAMVRYLQELTRVSKREDELREILEYTKIIVDSTTSVNDANTEDIITYELPTEMFWDAIIRLFDNPLFKATYSRVFDIMGHDDGPIEMRHFVKHSGVIYPLWNTSILVDYYKILLNVSSTENVEKHEHSLIESLLDESFNFAPNSPNRVLLSPYIVDKDTKKKIITKGLLFAATTKNSIILVIDGKSFDKETKLKDLINTITKINSQDGLCLLEPIYRAGTSGCFGLNIEPNNNITYIMVDSFTDIASHYCRCEDDSVEFFSCTALDLLYFIGFSDSFEELQEFIRFDLSNETQIFSFGGKSNLFLCWKKAYRMIAAGAFEYDYMNVDFNETERYTLSYFKDCLGEFPKNNSELFSDSLNWKALPLENGYNKVFRKGCHGFGGDVKKLWENGYVFLSHSVELMSEDDFEQSTRTAVNVIDELNQRLFARYAEQISSFDILQNKTLHILFIPWSYACKNHKDSFLKDSTRTVVYSDMRIDCDTVMIRFSIEPQVLLDLIKNSTDRTGENTYFKELIKPLSKHNPNEYEKLENKLNEDEHLKKTVGVFTIEQYYYFSDKAIDTEISKIGLTKARKEIAKACFESGAKPGKYIGRDATKIIRGMQASAVKAFEKLILEFDQFDLHYKALNYLAIQQNGIILNAKRYAAFRDLDEEVLAEFEQATRKLREEYRKNSDVAKYLIETNLTVSRANSGRECSDEDLSCLLSFADWLIVLQEDADVCFHQSSDFTIAIDDMYLVDPIPSDALLKQYERAIERKYNTTDYVIKNDETDIDFIKKAAKAFESDTGINFGTLITLIEFMQLHIIEENIAVEIYPNVFEIKKASLEEEFLNALEEKIDIQKIRETIDFITLNTSNLKIIDGVIHDLLPIWEREKRKDRFDIKPVILKDDKCIYSPVIMNSLLTAWKSGITEWFLPYEIGFTNLNEVLTQWKKRYEDEMVQDIADIFRSANFDIVIPELELYKRFPTEGYPEELGDYDVLAIHKSRKELWIIESKVLQKVASIYEAQMQQKSFFMQHKDDEKFQRRINYIRQNTSKVLSSLDVVEHDYKIIEYMVTNKLFESRYKVISFPIVTLDEFKEIIEGKE